VLSHPTGADPRFRTAAVVGAGLMGRRLAGVLASGGLSVRLTDTRSDVLPGAVEEAGEVARSLATAPGEVHAAPDLAEAVDGTDLVVEAVVEDLAVKQALFADLDRLAPHAVLASNSSVLPVTAIVAKVTDPERALGTHWWNPPDLIPIVEVIQGEHTGETVVAEVMALLERLGKLPVRVRRDVPGFVGNRLQHALWREALALVSEGVADAETVDLVARNTIGLRLAQMGPIENADYVGLDLTAAIHQAVLPALSRATEPDGRLRELVAAGHLGAKTGSGYLGWEPGRRDRTAAALAAHVSRELSNHRTNDLQESQ
jgi:3-hydroxybutyryl-CoA dehydrogenase